MTNLYAGTGDPCAGQERLNDCVAAFSIVKPLNSPENLGREPPTGSERVICTTDLYDGTGDPWAGQERLKGFLEALLNVELVDSPENFGEEPPTGSEIKRCRDKPV